MSLPCAMQMGEFYGMQSRAQNKNFKNDIKGFLTLSLDLKN